MVADLDSWQAMELDVALATKFSILEKEEKYTQLDVILSAVDNLMRVQGAKIKKRKHIKSLIGRYRTIDEIKAVDDLPSLNEVLQALGGGITVVNMEGLIENG